MSIDREHLSPTLRLDLTEIAWKISVSLMRAHPSLSSVLNDLPVVRNVEDARLCGDAYRKAYELLKDSLQTSSSPRLGDLLRVVDKAWYAFSNRGRLDSVEVHQAYQGFVRKHGVP